MTLWPPGAWPPERMTPTAGALAGDLPPGAVGRLLQPVDPLFRRPRGGVEAGDKLLQRRAVALQHAERPFQAHGVEHRRQQQTNKGKFEKPFHACHPGPILGAIR